MLTVKQIGVLSVAKFLGVLYAGLGLVFGLIISLFSVFGSILGGLLASNPTFRDLAGGSQGSIISLAFGRGAVIALPIFYGILGFVGGLIFGLIGNLALGISGGIELKVKTK